VLDHVGEHDDVRDLVRERRSQDVALHEACAEPPVRRARAARG
jgi:hypothetical protein